MSKTITHGIPRCARLSLLKRVANERGLGDAELVYEAKSRQQGLLEQAGSHSRSIRLSEIEQFVLHMTGQAQPSPPVPESDTDPQIEMTEHGTASILYISFVQPAVKGSEDKPKKNQHKLVRQGNGGWEHQASELVDKSSQQKFVINPKVDRGNMPRSADLGLLLHRPRRLCTA